MNALQNTEKRGLLICYLVMFAGILLLVLPTIFDADMMGWGYAAGFIGVVIALTAFIISFLYRRRIAVMQKFIDNTEMLAHWTYDETSYKEDIEKEFTERKEINNFWLKIVLLFFVIFTTPFAIFGFDSYENEERIGFILLLGACATIISLAAVIAPYAMRASALKKSRDTYVSRDGLYHHGMLHIWQFPFGEFRGVQLKKDTLYFTLAYLTKLGWIKYEEYVVKVEVPNNELETAKKIIDVFKKS